MADLNQRLAQSRVTAVQAMKSKTILMARSWTEQDIPVEWVLEALILATQVVISESNEEKIRTYDGQ